MKSLTTEEVYLLLEEVKDPEIPVLSLVDLGVITAVKIEDEKIHIEMTPTFVGCPALDIMRQEIYDVLRKHSTKEIFVTVSFENPWSSDKISERGRLALKNFGLAPPPAGNIFLDLEILDHVTCPRCDSSNTEIRNIFGSTLCRSMHYCLDCKEAFEQFKPL